MDLAEGHVAALKYLSTLGTSGSISSGHHCAVFNLGSGIGYSVLQMLSAMEKVRGN